MVNGAGWAFARRDGHWELRIPRPSLARLEYQLGIVDQHGPLLQPGRPGQPAAGGHRLRAEVGRRDAGLPSTAVAHGAGPGRALYDALAVRGGDHRRPAGDRLVARGDVGAGAVAVWRLVQDGPEYDVLASLSRYFGALIAAGNAAAPPARAARAGAAQRLVLRLPAVPAHADGGRTRPAEAGLRGRGGKVAWLGASLGGLTALLAGLHAPREVGAVFSQSGSFFQIRHDDRHDSVTTFPPLLAHHPSGCRRSSTCAAPTGRCGSG